MKAFALGRVIPLVEVSVADSAKQSFQGHDVTTSELPLRDACSRPLRDLRISVTDRCNFRCIYCMPKEVFGKDYAFLPRHELLSFEEIERVARVFVGLGVEKIRLTGGEPLLRKDLEHLVARLATLRTLRDADVDLTLTTNGSLLSREAQALRNAGMKRITVSLDAIDETVFQRMNGVGFSALVVQQGIDAALRAGFAPVKVNMVVKRGVNDSQILPIATHFRGTGVEVRFIEFMDVGTSNGWNTESVVPSSEIVRIIDARFPLIPTGRHKPSDTSVRLRYADGLGSIGVISSVSQPFCGDCTRLRLSADGQLFTCLFASHGLDIRMPMRTGDSDDVLCRLVAGLWRQRADRYSEQRGQMNAVCSSQKVEMSFIGG
ncbi:cyclic pyranopterin phosphate synthase [Paraburkholderia phenoliruptrix]|uniref:GTP 3',8-cyclase MoaA n=1 Tax=Paraburkholderia phenoliruptrix TaxID=252970 RepID=UPI00285D23D4|nr:GTP 3',8-cyclase MoaA [Paraburkholderia phenoliruptrix]MDR6419946.1 cyclic pyranopterin phosphate synthase [Paraburkholderia phenoliruptrix]